MSILSSVVVVALITGVFTIVSLFRNDYINNIVAERSKWRGELRDIIAQIAKCKCLPELQQLTKTLQVRINANGLVEEGFVRDRIDPKWCKRCSKCKECKDKPEGDYPYTLSEVKEDVHLWELIRDIDSGEPKYLENYKSALTKYISVLLKADWERSKEEVSVNKNLVYTTLSIVVFLLVTVFFYYFLFQPALNIAVQSTEMAQQLTTLSEDGISPALDDIDNSASDVQGFFLLFYFFLSTLSVLAMLLLSNNILRLIAKDEVGNRKLLNIVFYVLIGFIALAAIYPF